MSLYVLKHEQRPTCGIYHIYMIFDVTMVTDSKFHLELNMFVRTYLLVSNFNFTWRYKFVWYGGTQSHHTGADQNDTVQRLTSVDQGRKFLVVVGGMKMFPKKHILGLLLEPKYSIYLKLGYFWSPSRDFGH